MIKFQLKSKNKKSLTIKAYVKKKNNNGNTRFLYMCFCLDMLDG